MVSILHLFFVMFVFINVLEFGQVVSFFGSYVRNPQKMFFFIDLFKTIVRPILDKTNDCIEFPYSAGQSGNLIFEYFVIFSD
ncbi:MAG: hypothetical protein ACD_17C00400G0001 [uncultured bacterium]|nr:MAG: hypothetical protein ACD_17C00400G0001 [uncultured bacterium]